MAPSQAALRKPSTEKPLKSILKNSSTQALTRSEALFATSKKDKRRIKHAQLISKVTKNATSKPRRRRPNNKLVTTLDSLADALPTDDGALHQKTSAGDGLHTQVNVIQRKSMKSKPGALKRREKLDKMERDRFAKNLAQLSAARPLVENGAATDAPPTTTAVSEKWAALRGFISQTLEQKPKLQVPKG